MPVLPVIDLKGGLVVRGVAGQRERYRPVESVLTDSPTPSAVASAFAAKLSARDVYLADLEALAGCEPDWGSYRQVAAEGLRLWLDCGVGNLARAQAVVRFAHGETCLAGIVIALESVASPADLPELLSIVGPELAVFSLDLLQGAPLTNSKAWREHSPQTIAGLAWQAGFRRMVVVDLAQVGVGQGPSLGPLCGELHRAIPAFELIAGGGIRSVQDVQRLASAGCRRVLVASALHDGRLTAAELAGLG